MLTPDGKRKYLCPECGGDNVGESGMGEKYFHCFDRCMVDIPKKDCPAVPVTPEEAEVLRQGPY